MKKLHKLLLLVTIMASAFLNNYQAALGQTRLGLHYTDDELVVWQTRAVSGPYKTKSDVSPNSPGDWDRILANRNSFNSSPSADRYSKVYAGAGQVPDLNEAGYKSEQDPDNKGVKTRDAAFHYLIKGDATSLNNVRTELLWHANNSLLDFSNASRWGPGQIRDLNPGFIIAEWLGRLLYAYDYVKGGLSGGDKAILNAWFLNAGRYMATNYDISLNSLFVNRNAGNYTFTTATANNTGKLLMYYGGPNARYVSKIYSNRRTSLAAVVGLIGVFLNDANLIASFKRYSQEYFRFGVYPTGYSCDFVRSLTDKAPDKGLGYAVNSTWLAAIDALARFGDTELYTWTTTAGDMTASVALDRTSNGTTPKGLPMHLEAMARLFNGSDIIYSSKVAPAGNVNLRMDRDDAVKNTHIVPEIAYAMAAKYYAGSGFTSTYLTQTVKRTQGSQGGVYPASPTAVGANAALSFYGGMPGMSLMFVDVPVWPYGAMTGKLAQSITFNAIPAKTFGDASFTLTATATSGLAVGGWTSSNTGVATINSSTGVTTIVGAGSTIITVSQAGNGSYNPAPDKAQTLTVGKASQSITFPAIADKDLGDGKFRLPAATSTSGGIVTFSIVAGTATISSQDTVNPVIAESVTVRASQVGSANYLAAPVVNRTFNITASAPPGVTNLLSGVASSDTNRYVYDGLGHQRLESTRWFVLAGTQTGYTPRKLTIPSGFGAPDNTLGITEVWVRNAAGVSTQVGTFDATAQPIFEANIDAGAFTFNTVYFRTYGKNIRMRTNAGATGIKLEGSVLP